VNRVTIGLLTLFLFALAACGTEAPTATPVPPTAPPAPTVNSSGPVPGAAHITVQHILIGFVGTVPGKNITRTQDEARKLAYDLLAQAQGGADFDTLVRNNTDDQFPGTYAMANTGVAPAGDETPREGMVPAFGNVGFRLKVGEVGIADYDPQTSPFGYHVIKRIK
jgi:hypothetical protein